MSNWVWTGDIVWNPLICSGFLFHCWRLFMTMSRNESWSSLYNVVKWICPLILLIKDLNSFSQRRLWGHKMRQPSKQHLQFSSMHLLKDTPYFDIECSYIFISKQAITRLAYVEANLVSIAVPDACLQVSLLNVRKLFCAIKLNPR